MRLNTAGEILQTLSSVELYTEVAPNVRANTNAAIAKGAAIAAFAGAPAGFANGDPIALYGSGGPELNFIGGAVVANVPLGYKAGLAQAVGCLMAKLQKADLGYLERAGLKLGVQLQSNPILAANSRVAIAYSKGAGEMNGSLSLYGANLENVGLSHGVDASGITGVGGVADPYQLVIDGLSLASHGLMFLRAKGVRDDFVNVQTDLNGVTITPNGDVTWSDEGAMVIPVTLPVPEPDRPPVDLSTRPGAPRGAGRGGSTSRSTPRRDWGVEGLRARCAQLRDHLTARTVGVQSRSSRRRGGPPSRPTTRRRSARGCSVTRTTRASWGAPRSGRAFTTLRRVVKESLDDTPATLVCSDGVTRRVYPKSLHVHAVLQDLDAEIGDPRGGRPHRDRGRRRVTTARTRCAATRCCHWCWIVTTPGVGLPYDEDGETPSVPDDAPRAAAAGRRRARAALQPHRPGGDRHHGGRVPGARRREVAPQLRGLRRARSPAATTSTRSTSRARGPRGASSPSR
jgi:hypothetical protein